jgi:hypothetical protein
MDSMVDLDQLESHVRRDFEGQIQEAINEAIDSESEDIDRQVSGEFEDLIAARVAEVTRRAQNELWEELTAQSESSAGEYSGNDSGESHPASEVDLAIDQAAELTDSWADSRLAFLSCLGFSFSFSGWVRSHSYVID